MAVYLPLAIACLILGGLAPLMGFLGKKNGKEDYDFLTYFPYELYGDSRGPYRLSARILQISALLCPVAAEAYFLTSIYGDGWGQMAFPLAMAFIALFAFLALTLLSLVPAGEPKRHVALFFLGDALALLTLFMGGIFLLNQHALGEESVEAAALVLAIVLFVLAFFLVLVLANPKLAHWATMKRESQPDGTFRLRRPRPFVMAFSEWLVYAVYIVGSSLLILGLAFIVVD
ncbi:MAG: hypothetical protein LKK13_04045 [Bacilli bacterium]|nr:hypothetical protein [Bacilli bacterium]